MALPWWIENARNSLQAASNSYADIQRQLDRYNKVFEVYSQASPETQMRAASVMRQAINEYNGLKRQQEENAIRIYEAQSWLNYYNRNGKWEVQQVQTPLQSQLSQAAVNSFNMPEVQTAAVEEVPVITTETPWTLNNNTAATYVEANALDTDQTVNVPVNQVFANVQAQNTVKPTTPIWVTNYINSTTPKLLARCPPFLPTTSIIFFRISDARIGNLSLEIFFKSSGFWLFPTRSCNFSYISAP